MKLHLWGTDFRRSTPEMRGKLFCAPEYRERLLKDLVGLGFSDLVYLYTCNRIEFYTTANDYFSDTRQLWLKLLNHLGLPAESYYQGYQLEGKSALRHLLRVACSLESLVIGEPQILGQLKEALRSSKDSSIPVQPPLEKCFHFAFETAKQVRSETALGEKPVSVATLGLQHLQLMEARYPLENVVIVGRSPISVIVAEWLQKHRPETSFLWVNRNVSALDGLPGSETAQKMSLAEFLENPPAFSHMFTATSSSEPLFAERFFARIANRPLIFDFAEPPDVDRRAAKSANTELIHLEDLMEEARENAASRARAVEAAEVILETALRDFCLQQKEAPLLKDFGSIEPQFLGELASALASFEGECPAELQPKLRRWAEKLVKKNLHLSREHLKTLLRQVTEPEQRVSEFL